MNKLISIAGIVALVAVGFYLLSSDDTKRSLLAKAGNATMSGEKTPAVVAEQQRKEALRQDKTWTAENRAQYPIEFCRAQLEELSRRAVQVEAAIHETGCKKAEVERVKADNTALVKNLEDFLAEGKAKYREAEKNNAWPVKVGGFALSQDKLKDRIIDAATKIPELKYAIATEENQLVYLAKKDDANRAEQARVAKLRERVEAVIGDLQLKQVIDGNNGVRDALNAISDQMSTLGVDYNDPKLEDIVKPDKKTTRDVTFEKIMAE